MPIENQIGREVPIRTIFSELNKQTEMTEENVIQVNVESKEQLIIN